MAVLGDQAAITFKKLPSARVESITGLQDIVAVVHQFDKTLRGPDIYAYPMMANVFTDVRYHIVNFLENAAKEDLTNKQFIVVTVDFQASLEPETKKLMFLWAICPACEEEAVQSYVARKSLNRTLVLAKSQEGGSTLRPMAYLTMTDLICRTLLVRVAGDGKIDMTLRARLRMDIISNSPLNNRFIDGKVDLDTEEMEFGNLE